MDMGELTVAQREYAAKYLQKIAEKRGLTQKQLEELGHVNQSTISKIFNGEFLPSEDILRKLSLGVGLDLSEIVEEADALPDGLIGYLATPLTGIAKNATAEAEVASVVERIRASAADREFLNPGFSLYWPGDHTHPIRNANFTPEQVYRIDRSRASAYHFTILFCAAPSFGVGQENEIATQAGIPAIRFLPEGVSRMMVGSFIRAVDIRYAGSLDRGVRFSEDELREALREMIRTHFQLRALYKNLNGKNFGPRLQELINQRWGTREKAAAELGVSLHYVHAMVEEPLIVSNPSAVLLRRIAHRLGVTVSYVLGESDDLDPIWAQSNTNWRKWIDQSGGIDAKVALEIRDEWRQKYREAVGHDTGSLRKPSMQVEDWRRQYTERTQRIRRDKERGLLK